MKQNNRKDQQKIFCAIIQVPKIAKKFMYHIYFQNKFSVLEHLRGDDTNNHLASELIRRAYVNRTDGAVGQSVQPASGSLGVRIPAATDLIRKNR